MRYGNVRGAVVLERPNRFTARVLLDGRAETVHVKNTGRLGELLLPGAPVYLTAPGTPGRKTAYDLITVRRKDGSLVNIDSQAPNRAAREWLDAQGFDEIVPELRYGESRIDFAMRRGNDRFLMEVKGCTLEIGGIGYFPDAPTQRGVRHIRELIRAAGEGVHAVLAFVIQMDGVREVRPNEGAHPLFASAMREGREAGVRILFLPCRVGVDSLEAVSPERL